MESLLEWVRGWTLGSRVAVIVVLAVLAHLFVLTARKVGEWLLARDAGGRDSLARRRPKVASLVTLLVSTVTFVVYFGAVGLILSELGVSMTTYFASATVIGLAIGFGSQGLVQDIVIGLTLIFSDALDVGDVADIGGQTGRVESIGLRFTVLRTLVDQQVFVPNRNVGQINRYRKGYVRVYVDTQLPEGVPLEELQSEIEEIAGGMHSQHPDIVLTRPETLGIKTTEPGGWTYLRLKFRIWPGQGPLIEGPFRQRVLATVRRRVTEYADWMVVVTYRARG
ncbi:MAG: mechanosensitive ion channel [Longimicrobiales bacterium]|nr:mechanosensitive ion channel [Longimicrobiales bacterium]